jgi:hypothetical protein
VFIPEEPIPASDAIPLYCDNTELILTGESLSSTILKRAFEVYIFGKKREYIIEIKTEAEVNAVINLMLDFKILNISDKVMLSW